MRRSTVLSLSLQLVFPAMDMLLAEIGFFSSLTKDTTYKQNTTAQIWERYWHPASVGDQLYFPLAKISLRRGKEKKWRSFLPKFWIFFHLSAYSSSSSKDRNLGRWVNTSVFFSGANLSFSALNLARIVFLIVWKLKGKHCWTVDSLMVLHFSFITESRHNYVNRAKPRPSFQRLYGCHCIYLLLQNCLTQRWKLFSDKIWNISH